MRIRNVSIGQWFARIFDAKSGEEPTEVLPYVTPIIDLRPKIDIVKSAASGTIYTTPLDKDFYLTNVIITTSHSAADTGTSEQLRVYINGVQISIIYVTGINAQAQDQTVVENYYYPIKIDRGTIIDITASGTWTATRIIIKGYTVETLKGS